MQSRSFVVVSHFPMVAACQPGTYSNSQGLGQCLRCPAGTASHSLSLDGRGASICVDCKAGDLSDCSDRVVSDACSLDDLIGTFAEGAGQSECFACAPGSFSATSRSGSCQPCLAGKFSNSSASTTCFSCPPVRFALTSADAESLIVAQGKFSDANSPSCTGCLFYL